MTIHALAECGLGTPWTSEKLPEDITTISHHKTNHHNLTSACQKEVSRHFTALAPH